VQPRRLFQRDLSACPIFDSHRPPDPAIIDHCVHCGFCLDACPTYVLWAEEADSPRGRIVLMSEAAAPGAELSEEMVAHFDRCLGCMACVTACPSGVRYDRLVERVRPQVERHHRRPRAERALRRLLFETLPHPGRLRTLVPLLAAGRRLPVARLPGTMGALAKVAPRTRVRPALAARHPERVAGAGEQRGRVGVLLGCVQRVFYPQTNLATIRTLSAEGFEVIIPRLAGCCGALELHAGAEDAAIARARRTMAAFDGVDHVVVNAAGCGSAMKEYGEIVDTPEARAFSARVQDVSELLASIDRRVPRAPVPLRVAYHDACHLAHAQGIRDQPRELLQEIPGLELLEVATERDICCGSAGIYNLIQPEAAAELGMRKARNLLATGAQAIAAGNPGCAAQLDVYLRELGAPLPIHHPIELVWRSIAGAAA
jgi:glycolate oxidase iron-sulfur subunit